MSIISVSNVSKQYRLGQVGTGTLHQDVNRWWHRLRGKEDPYLKIGETNDRSAKGSSDFVWALKDINFEVQAGEVLGIIGRNGAGKSTLLKILSRVTEPTTGSITMHGRVASLLEVGTGFHPDLTGRENIYLNGAILGMTKKEIARKFDEIVDFAGVERYIDTPVKRYSSGMHVRLGFAVAAHLEPEILIVDEVLAVGDAEFQKKCLGKMKDVSVNEGRTVLFVSHDLRAITRLCNRSLVLSNGCLMEDGDTEIVVDHYQKNLLISKKSKRTVSNGNASLSKFGLNGNTEVEYLTIEFGTPLQVTFEIACKQKTNAVGIAICFDDQLGNRILSCWTAYQGNYFTLNEGLNE
ncbi:MAG: ABC transporter ATP-binding protein, partial [Bacteroidetes bacterium]